MLPAIILGFGSVALPFYMIVKLNSVSPRDEIRAPHTNESRTDATASKIMKELTSTRAITIKGILFLVLGVISAVLLVLEHPSARVVVLLLLTIWSFCRFYYFAFYVIEHYVDPGYRFSGLFSLARSLVSKYRSRGQADHVQPALPLHVLIERGA